MIKKIKSFIFYRLYRVYTKLRKYHQESKYQNFRKTYNISDTFIFNGEDITMYGNGQIIIGEESYIGRYSSLQSVENYKIQIGKKCAISHNVRFYTQSIIPDDDWENIPKRSKKGNIILDDYVWIGANVLISPNVHIGKCSVVGANSVVTKDIPAYTIYGGVPAKLIRNKKKHN